MEAKLISEIGRVYYQAKFKVGDKVKYVDCDNVWPDRDNKNRKGLSGIICDVTCNTQFGLWGYCVGGDIDKFCNECELELIS